MRYGGIKDKGKGHSCSERLDNTTDCNWGTSKMPGPTHGGLVPDQQAAVPRHTNVSQLWTDQVLGLGQWTNDRGNVCQVPNREETFPWCHVLFYFVQLFYLGAGWGEKITPLEPPVCLLWHRAGPINTWPLGFLATLPWFVLLSPTAPCSSETLCAVNRQ